MNFWEKLQLQLLSFKKVGDTVDLSNFEVVERGRINGECPLCHEPTDAEIETYSGVLTTFKDEDLCLKHLNNMES